MKAHATAQAGASQPSAAATSHQHLTEGVADRLLDALFGVMLPTVMAAVKWSDRGRQPLAMDSTAGAAHAELLGQLGFAMISFLPAGNGRHGVGSHLILNSAASVALLELSNCCDGAVLAHSSSFAQDLTRTSAARQPPARQLTAPSTRPSSTHCAGSAVSCAPWPSSTLFFCYCTTLCCWDDRLLVCSSA